MGLSIEKEYSSLIMKKLTFEKELSSLPDGYISSKTIKGKTQHYLQKREGKKIVGKYIRADEVQKTTDGIERRKTVSSEIARINERLIMLEQAAKIVGYDLFCRLMVIKMSSGMDELDSVEKQKCASFGNAMNAVEGVPVSEQTGAEIKEWEDGKRTFLSVFESTLRRYGFHAEA